MGPRGLITTLNKQQSALYGVETWTLRKVYQKYLENFERWCWRRIEKISWIDGVRNEVSYRGKEETNILYKITR